ncbi:MAG: plasmid partitioning protein [Rhodospirillales bacterium]
MAGRHLRPAAVSAAAARRRHLAAACLSLLVTALPAMQSPAGETASEDTAVAPPLPRLGLDRDGVTVSGISSGGYMAHQLHVAHAASITGAGIIAGGPWSCAGNRGFPGNLVQVFARCMSLPGPMPFLGPPDVAPMLAEARQQATLGTIDDPAKLAGSHVYLFSGENDDLVPASVVATIGSFYAAFMAPATIHFETSIAAPHAMVTNAWGAACETTETPFINNCGFDLAGAILKAMYDPLIAPAETADAAGEPAGDIVTFDQQPFVQADRTSGLAATGYLFVPAACRTAGTGCRLHVAFHGCAQAAARIGDAFVRHAGYNRWAAANRIVVLYPQAAAVERSILGIAVPWPNPEACWDWWGFTGPDYALKSAPQIAAVTAMIDRLTTPARPSSPE